MNYTRVLLIILSGLLLHSCSVEDPVPSSGENSFFALLNGEKYVPKNFTHFPSGTHYGLQVYKREDGWYIDVHNRTDENIYLSITGVEQPGDYLVQKVDLQYPNQIPLIRPTSAVIGNPGVIFYLTQEEESPEYIKITEVQENLIVGEFRKITLRDPENPDNKALLTHGQFHINLATLNKD